MCYNPNSYLKKWKTSPTITSKVKSRKRPLLSSQGKVGTVLNEILTTVRRTSLKEDRVLVLTKSMYQTRRSFRVRYTKLNREVVDTPEPAQSSKTRRTKSFSIKWKEQKKSLSRIRLKKSVETRLLVKLLTKV